MRTRHVRHVTLLAVLAGMLFSVLAPPVAAHDNRYEELQKKIDRTKDAIEDATRRERSLLERINASQERSATLERKVAALGDQLHAAVTKLELLNARLDRVTAELHLTTAELEQAIAALEHQNHVLADRARALYILGRVDYTQALIGARNFDDVVSGYYYAQTVLEGDNQLLDDIRTAKERIEGQRLAVESKRDKVRDATLEQEKITNRIAALKEQQDNARAQVQREIDYRRRLLGEVRSEKSAYERALKSYIAESRRIEDLLRDIQKGQRAIQGRGGYLKWPISGRITSPYGWRTHPIHKTRSFHAGIDIGAPQGSTIRAARYGTVVYSGYRGAYGLIVVVDHGDALATLYAHMSRTYVRAGDRVSTQAALGAVGCSGWCTGPHLHFEVRVNGSPTNPRAWL